MRGSRSALRWITAVTASALCLLPVPALAASQTFVPDAWYQSGSTATTANTSSTITWASSTASAPAASAPASTSTVVGDGWYQSYAYSGSGSSSMWAPAGAASTASAATSGSSTATTSAGSGATTGTAAASPAPSSGSAADGGSYGVGTGSPANMPADAAEIISWTNATRAQHGLPPLTENALLDHIALLKCQDMVNNNYFSHDSPTYGMPLQMQQAFGVQARIMGAENLAGARDTALAYTMLVNSPGHLANILYNGLTDIGVAVVPLSVYGVYVCQEFTGN